ncbi:MAG: acyl-CoA dehydrogenase family protein [Myxococcales bacterium]|jgi:alkylation response protein AidB-like acyl-CoA dehydrogenase|nr:acyl-CoA dehydrogenase family protein [Myxococcales bacterium]
MQDVLDSVRRFTEGEIAPHAAEVDRSGRLPEGIFRRMGEAGLTGLAIPEKWGGVDADLATFAASLEIVGAACASTAWALLAHTMCARTLVGAGTDAQKSRLLPGLASGATIGAAMAGTEAGGGSNPMGMRTHARRDGDGWVIDGAKEFISLAGYADLFVVMARTGEAPPAIGCFLVEKTDAGFTSGRREELLGMHGVPVGGLAFANCRVGADRLLGAEAGGLMVMGMAGAWGLAGAAGAAMGIAGAALYEAGAFVKERVVAGAALATLPGVQATLGDLQMELAASRAGLAQALREIEGRKGPPLPLFRAKLAATECAVHVADRCMGLHGAAGYSRALPAERRVRDVRAFGIHWGNNEVLRDTIRKGSVA